MFPMYEITMNRNKNVFRNISAYLVLVTSNVTELVEENFLVTFLINVVLIASSVQKY